MALSTVGDALQDRILDATLRCAARWGVSKTTLDDVAREAGCSRATIYRTFAGGKDALLAAAARREIERFFEQLAARLDATESLDDLLVAAITEAARWVAGQDVFQYLLTHEPEVVLPHLAFHRLDALFAVVAAHAAPHLAPYVPPGDAPRIAEWVTRLVLSYTLVPSADVDLTDDADARRLVTGLLVPGISVRTSTSGS
jgi:AcrR family transcriptional regulator